MKRWQIKVVLFVLGTLMSAASLLAQGWPVPASTPRTDLPCNTSGCLGKENLKVVGYPPTLRFVGRYLDSTANRDYQFPFRTARVREIRSNPARNRIYMMLGSALAAYDSRTFYTRLQNKEPLFPSTSVPTSVPNQRSGIPEEWLAWHKYFYAEYGSPWTTVAGDGQERLFGYDFDDRNHVYLAYGPYGWGIVTDDGGTDGLIMPTVLQYLKKSDADVAEPTRVISLKVNGTYYALVTAWDATGYNVWNVNTPATPVRHVNVPRRSFVDWAKNDDASRIAWINRSDLAVEIFAADAAVSGSAPLIARGSYPNEAFASVTTDGTRFIAAAMNDSTGAITLSIFTPSGGSFTETKVSTGLSARSISAVRFGAGLIGLAYYSRVTNAYDVAVFRLTGEQLTAIPLEGYFGKYYHQAAPAGYASPSYTPGKDLAITKVGGKTYLNVAYFGLGDVYEILGGTSVTATVKAVGREANPHSKQASQSGPYYGDEITFSSTATGESSGVIWNWGDGSAEETKPVSSPDIAHQYHGLTAAQLPATRTVTATAASDASAKETLTVTLKKPTVRVGIRGSSLLFLQPNASAPPQIVAGDEWVDESDGSIEGHFAEWNIDGASTKLGPATPIAVGDCGAHSLSFTAHYGKRDTSFNPVAADAPFSINGINYAVRPFSAAIADPVSSGTNVVFKSAARASASTAALSSGSTTPVTYTWLLVDANGAAVTPETKLDGNATIATIPDFIVPRARFQGATNWRAKLSLSVDPALIAAAACRSFASVSDVTAALSGPDPSEIAKDGCLNAGSPCSMSVVSNSGADRSNWTYLWTVSGPASVASGTQATFSPAFTQAGTYTINLLISNALGDASKSTTVTVSAPLCSSTPSDTNIAINFAGGGPTNCSGAGSTCGVGESITFRVSPYGWVPADCDVYTWDFGDGTTSNLKQPSKTYNSPGTYNVKLKVKGGLSEGNVQTTITVGSTQPQPSCPTMQANWNVYIGYTGAQSNCNPNFGNCSAGENLNFQAAVNGYSFSCAPHSFAWTFGDGTTSTSQNPTKSYAVAGTYNVSLIISNATQQVTLTQAVTVGGGSTGACATMVANSNVVMNFTGPTSNCTAAGGNCRPAETISFQAAANGYNFACAAHTFQWNFGDGQTATGQTTSHAYAQPGTYTVTVTIGNPTQSGVTITKQVVVTQPDGSTCSVIQPGLNVFVLFQGPETQCSPLSGTCMNTETVNFAVGTYFYNFSCGTHSFEWDFADGTPKVTTQNAPHKFANPGTYIVTLKITSPTGVVTVTQPVKVGGTSVDPSKPGPTNRRRSSGRR